jgi:hypothetical protein
MLLRRWIAVAFAVSLAGVAANGWTALPEGGAAAAEPPVSEDVGEAAAEPPVSEGVGGPDVTEEPTVEDQATRVADDRSLVLPPAPPRSLQTLVEERRDLLRERRRARFDLYSGRYLHYPHGFGAYDETMDRYRDAMRTLHRRQRDHVRLHHDVRLDAMAPWSRPQREWSRTRSFLIQMEQLDRQEALDLYWSGEPFAYARTIPW